MDHSSTFSSSSSTTPAFIFTHHQSFLLSAWCFCEQEVHFCCQYWWVPPHDATHRLLTSCHTVWTVKGNSTCQRCTTLTAYIYTLIRCFGLTWAATCFLCSIVALWLGPAWLQHHTIIHKSFKRTRFLLWCGKKFVSTWNFLEEGLMIILINWVMMSWDFQMYYFLVLWAQQLQK